MPWTREQKLDELDAAARKSQQEAQQRCDRLQQELDEALRAKDEADAKARAEAELREIFRLTDQDRSGWAVHVRFVLHQRLLRNFQ